MKKNIVALIIVLLIVVLLVGVMMSGRSDAPNEPPQEPLTENVTNLCFSLKETGKRYNNRLPYELSTTSNRILISAIQYLYNSLNNPSSFKVIDINILEQEAECKKITIYNLEDQVAHMYEREEKSGTITWDWYHVKEISDTLIYCKGEPFPLSKITVDYIKTYGKVNLPYTVYFIQYEASYPYGLTIEGKERVYVVSENEMYFEDQIYNVLDPKDNYTKTYYAEKICIKRDLEKAKDNWVPSERLEHSYCNNIEDHIYFIVDGLLVDSVLDKTHP